MNPTIDFNTATPLEQCRWFIEFFTAIPDEQWVCGTLYGGEEGVCCANGHLLERRTFDGALALNEMLQTISPQEFHGWNAIARINDGKSDLYQQPTPRARILAALGDILKKLEAAQ